MKIEVKTDDIDKAVKFYRSITPNYWYGYSYQKQTDQSYNLIIHVSNTKKRE
jgi:hypothetical protein